MNYSNLDSPGQKPHLDRTTLTDVIDLALWAGQLLMQHGAESQRVEETVHRLGTALGGDWMDVFVSPNAIIVTTSLGTGEFRTKIRRVILRNVNMAVVAEVSRLSRRVVNGELNRFQVRTELQRIATMPPFYNRWLVVLMVGLACAAFSRLFGGDWIIFGITFGAASVAMFTRQELTKRHFNALMVVIVTAFVAGLLAGSAAFFQPAGQSRLAISASVLLLVPGIPLVNAVEDLIQGHPVVGLARGFSGALILLAIALGLLLALSLTGVGGL